MSYFIVGTICTIVSFAAGLLVGRRHAATLEKVIEEYKSLRG